MELKARHIRYLLVIVALSCLALVSVKLPSTERGCSAALSESESSRFMASFCEKENDMLNAIREMGQWGIPSSSVALQGSVEQFPVFYSVFQRALRACTIRCASNLSFDGELTESLSSTVSTKRFHSGYYLHYRCQMRC